MQIKQQMLAQQVQKRIAPLYVLLGSDAYLLDHSLSVIKTALKNTREYEEKVLSIQNADDWNKVLEEANSYSLFSDIVVLNLFYDKKSLDAAGKKALTEYLKDVNFRCVIIIRAPNVPAKQLQWLSAHEHAVVSVAYPLDAAAMKNWIAVELKKNHLQFDPQIPELIHQYTQGNMLACAQAIEKMILCYPPHTPIKMDQAREHLSNQCEHQLFELVDACLGGRGEIAMQILKHLANTKTEMTLVLWMLTQEVRTLSQLLRQMEQLDPRTACSQLKIWPQRIPLYQSCCARLNRDVLKQLHHYCYTLDERIKSSVSAPVWPSLENLALSLCLGKLVGDTCTI